jgi:hypothetical protein
MLQKKSANGSQTRSRISFTAPKHSPILRVKTMKHALMDYVTSVYDELNRMSQGEIAFIHAGRSRAYGHILSDG